MPVKKITKQTPQTTVVNIFKDSFDVYVGRTGLGFTSEFGNPYRIGRDGSRAEVITKFKKYFLNKITLDKEFRQRVQELKSKKLGCFCTPRACHADVIADYLNQ